MESTNEAPGRSEKVEQLHEQLQSSLQELVTSDDWQQALAVAARFHNYSFSNTQLIRAQALARGFSPSRVAGYRLWQQLGRQVRRGEHGIQILAPVIRKITPENGGEEERRVVGFRSVNVFDISQTDGEPLPEVTATLVEGDLPAHWERANELITTAGFDLHVADIDRLGSANGITDWQQRDVVVRASLPGAQRFKTAIHELAHIHLHEPTTKERPKCRGIVEVEAESVAYIVCAALEIDSASYSLPYVASWSGGDPAKVTATANRVIGCARTVLAELQRDRHVQHDGPPIEATRSSENQRVQVEATAPSRDPRDRRELEDVLTAAIAIYQSHLDDQKPAPAIHYLSKRAIDGTTAVRWQLGYAPPAWDTITNALHQQGFTDDVLLESGVVGRARTGKLYDRMRGRLIFPILDEKGMPRGLAGRLITGDGPKYLNTPETDLYQKRHLLYGMHLAHRHIADTGKAIVVEGYTDVIATHQAGLTNVVATGGTALTSDHLETLGNNAIEVTLAFDGDQAGLLAAQRAGTLNPAKQGVRLVVARLPPGRDPASLLAGAQTDLFQEAIANVIPIEFHLIDQILKQYDLEEPEAMARAIRTAASEVLTMTDPSGRAQCVAYLAHGVGRDKALIRRCLEDGTYQTTRTKSRHSGRSLA